MRRDITAFAQGYQDYKDGALEQENPYQPGTMLHLEWEEGWDKAWADFAHERAKEELDAAEVRRYR